MKRKFTRILLKECNGKIGIAHSIEGICLKTKIAGLSKEWIFNLIKAGIKALIWVV
jgi:hypothetical protein